MFNYGEICILLTTRQTMHYNVTFRRVCATTVAVEKQ
jgi:hypothetical protein